jgi:hypothetical protein
MARIAGFCLLLLLWLLIGTGLTHAAPAPKEAPSQMSVFLPGGVADPAGRYGYVTNTPGGIDALDLETGKTEWASAEASKPLVVIGDRVVAQADVKGKYNSVRIIVLDAKTGKRLLQSDPVTFPEWVSVVQTWGRSFGSDARIDKGDVLLRWEAHASYAGGAAPTPEIVRASKKDASGVAKISLETGRVEMLAPDKVPAVPEVKLPKELEKVTSLQYWTGSSWENKPMVVGDRVVALAVEPAQPKQKLIWKAWDLETAKAYEPVVLLEGKSLWPQVTPDRRYVLVHQALVKEQLPPGDYAWWIFALETGKEVAKIPFTEGTHQVGVVGPRVYCLVNGQAKGRPGPGGFTQPRFLKAYDLKSGKPVWEHEVKGQVFTPPPP